MDFYHNLEFTNLLNCKIPYSYILGYFECRGYIPHEYARQGVYSTKSDVFSFGVLLLQIISGKRLSMLCGINENLSILEHVSVFGYSNLEYTHAHLIKKYKLCNKMVLDNFRHMSCGKVAKAWSLWIHS